MNGAARRAIFWAGYKAGHLDANAGINPRRPEDEQTQIEGCWRTFNADCMAKLKAAARGEDVELDQLLTVHTSDLLVVVVKECTNEQHHKLCCAMQNAAEQFEIGVIVLGAMAGEAQEVVRTFDEAAMRSLGWIRADKAREEVDRQ